jgi:hypothetical protein
MPFALVVLFFAFIWGGWAKAAAEGLFAVLLVIDLVLVPFSVWWDAIRGLLTPALPPSGSDATLIGGLAGFTALASGLNWYVMNHYRDQGYGMGHRVGFLAGLRGERQEVRATGVTFPDDDRNAQLWKRWMGYLKLDMWLVFFGGAMVGMFLPIILMRQLVLSSGQQPTQANIATFMPNILGAQHGRWMFYVALFVGFLILFDTQVGIFEALVRNATDAANTSPRLRQALAGDPRRGRAARLSAGRRSAEINGAGCPHPRARGAATWRRCEARRKSSTTTRRHSEPRISMGSSPTTATTRSSSPRLVRDAARTVSDRRSSSSSVTCRRPPGTSRPASSRTT